MSTSYKALWQEVSQENDRLKTEMERLKKQHQRALDRTYAFLTSSRTDLAQTAPIVDLAGIARHMRVARHTPQQWAQRDVLPPVDYPEIKEPLWLASTIKAHFAGTERFWHDVPDGEDEAALSPAA